MHDLCAGTVSLGNLKLRPEFINSLDLPFCCTSGEQPHRTPADTRSAAIRTTIGSLLAKSCPLQHLPVRAVWACLHQDIQQLKNVSVLPGVHCCQMWSRCNASGPSATKARHTDSHSESACAATKDLLQIKDLPLQGQQGVTTRPNLGHLWCNSPQTRSRQQVAITSEGSQCSGVQ